MLKISKSVLTFASLTVLGAFSTLYANDAEAQEGPPPIEQSIGDAHAACQGGSGPGYYLCMGAILAMEAQQQWETGSDIVQWAYGCGCGGFGEWMIQLGHQWMDSAEYLWQVANNYTAQGGG